MGSISEGGMVLGEVGACCCMIIGEGVIGREEVTSILGIVKRIIIGGDVIVHGWRARFECILHCLVTIIGDFNREKF